MPDSVLSPVVETPVWRYRQTGLAPGQRLTVEQVSATDPVGATNAPDTGLMATIDHIADEVAVAMEYNGISHATVLATPQNLDDLARGFSLTEGIIRTPADIYDIEAVPHPNGITLQITIASACLNTLKQRRRTLAGTTGCGLCGLESLGDVERVLPTVVAPVMPLQPGALLAASLQLRDNQPLHQQTGATHAAGWANASGQLVQVMEDVGRHNALDKLVGYLARFPELHERGGFVVMSSRASFEIVQKAAAAGINAVVAISAPTAYAIRRAHDLNILLAGFARQTSFMVYTHPEYLCSQEPVS